MRKQRWTKGPWIITEGDEWTNDLHTVTEKQGNRTVVTCNGLRDEVKANKQLVSAVHDMVDALERIEDVMESEMSFDDLQCLADDTTLDDDHIEWEYKSRLLVRRAIAKAYGES